MDCFRIWEELPVFVPDPLLSLQFEFQKDPCLNKVDLSIGVYVNENTKDVFGSFVGKEAEKRLIETEINKRYLRISGDQQFITHMKSYVFGNDLDFQYILGVQALGGTGALSLGAELFRGAALDTKVYISEQTWDNHFRIFSQVGLATTRYPYYDFTSKKLSFEKLKSILLKADRNSLVLLHGCCHNPTGVDFSLEEWKILLEIFKTKGLIPFFDFAYQGFAQGIEEDRKPIALFTQELDFVLVASSLSKSFSLYGERTGFLGVFSKNKDVLAKVGSYFDEKIRGLYSSPPRRGAMIANTIFGDPELFESWKLELSQIRSGLNKKREILVEGLRKNCGDYFDFLGSQFGFFGYPAFSSEQISFLKKERSIYVGGGGRFNLAGINSENLDYIVKCFKTAHDL